MANRSKKEVTSHDPTQSPSEGSTIEGEPRPLTVREAGRKGGSMTAARHGAGFFQAIGRKGGSRVRELIARARAVEEREVEEREKDGE